MDSPSSTVRRSFACACDSVVEAWLRAAPPWAETGQGAHSGGGEGELLLVRWRWQPGGRDEGKRRRWRRRRLDEAGSWLLTKAQTTWVSPGNCYPLWVGAAAASG